MTTDVMIREYSRDIIMNAERNNQSTGQYLFNSLPEEARAAVTGTPFDPFYKKMSQYQIEDWLDAHVTFNMNGTIIGIIAGKKTLWGDR